MWQHPKFLPYSINKTRGFREDKIHPESPIFRQALHLSSGGLFLNTRMIAENNISLWFENFIKSKSIYTCCCYFDCCCFQWQHLFQPKELTLSQRARMTRQPNKNMFKVCVNKLSCSLKVTVTFAFFWIVSAPSPLLTESPLELLALFLSLPGPGPLSGSWSRMAPLPDSPLVQGSLPISDMMEQKWNHSLSDVWFTSNLRTGEKSGLNHVKLSQKSRHW